MQINKSGLKSVLVGGAFLAIGAISGRAEAGMYSCSSSLRNGESFNVEISFNNPGSKTQQVYRSNVAIGGKSVPMLGKGCFYSDRPSTRYIKCAHQSGNLRIEIYPTVETTSGALKLMQFIIWDGARPQKGGFNNCRQS